MITARLLAEKANPQADAVWGLAATSLMLLQKDGMLQGYAAKDVDQLKPLFRDSQNPPEWIGMDAWMAAICFNTVEAAKYNLPQPKTWQDLTKPVYRGHVVMPHPASSGTGYLDVSAWLQTFGAEKGWTFMDGLHQNIKSYTHSGSKPCKMAATGEAPIGISFAYRGRQRESRRRAAGADLPKRRPGLGNGSRWHSSRAPSNWPPAQTLMDWAASEKANQLYNEGYAILARPGIAKTRSRTSRPSQKNC